MGMAYPQYELDSKILNKILELVQATINDNWAEGRRQNITFRPLRPEEINETLTPETRIYASTATLKTYERVLGATASFRVKTGSVYLFLGWIGIQDATTPMDLSTSVRLRVDGVTRNEVSLALVNQMENNALLTLDQVVVANEDSFIDIEFKDLTGVGTAIVYPLAYRIGPKAQLDVS